MQNKEFDKENHNDNEKLFDKKKRRHPPRKNRYEGIINMREMLQSGSHFGHNYREQNPKMKEYIFNRRADGTSIIDLNQTVRLFDKAYDFAKSITASGSYVLFVGTKSQAKNIVKEGAEFSNMYYVNHKWLGGMLTNWKTIQASIKKLKELETLKEEGYGSRPKKEIRKIEKRIEKLSNTFAGVRDMKDPPGALFIIDPTQDPLAVQEAMKLNIPIIALTDSNANPELIDYIIPANDDAVKSVQLFTSKISEACLKGLEEQRARLANSSYREEDQDTLSKDDEELSKEFEQVEKKIEVIRVNSKNKLSAYISP